MSLFARVQFAKVWLLVAAIVLCFSCSGGGGAAHEQVGTDQSTTMSGEGLCRTSVLDADGTSASAVVEPGIDASHPIVGYLPRTAEVLWSNVPATFTAQGHVAFVAQEASGGFDITASPGAGGPTIAISNITPTNILTSAMLHITSFSLTWQVTSTMPGSAIAIRVRVSPFQDGGTNRCLIYSCDPAKGPQVCSPAAVGTLCSDGNACNGQETCDGEGACVAGTNLPNGTSCSDGNVCNGSETCQSGSCSSGAPLTPTNWDDHNDCTADACDPTRGGIVNDLIPTCIDNANAPALDQTAPVAFDRSTSFLYEVTDGVNPVQVGVPAGTIDMTRVAVIRGRIFTSPTFASSTKEPASGATVTVVGHSEYGTTLSRADGSFDLAVNGGGPLTVNVAKNDYLTVQRTVGTGPHGYSIADDVVLTAPFTSPDKFTPGVSTPTVIHGAVTPANEDADDKRQAVIMLPAGTHIKNYAGPPPAGGLSVQLTEYTRGPNGPERMPGALPPTSGYTYAFEASIPEVGQDVTFVDANGDPKSVVTYVDSFTGAQAGEDVPLGYYDRTKGAWLAQKSGKTIKILWKGSGTVTLDLGTGSAATTAELAALGIDTAELQTIASQSQWGVNTILWRLTMNHFSAWDANWGFGAPTDAVSPPDPNITDGNTDCNSIKSGSIIGCESRILGETIPVAGTPFKLYYSSDRVLSGKGILIRLVGEDALPPSVVSIHVDIYIAGRMIPLLFAPMGPNSTILWTWDGLDAYGRFAQGTNIAKVDVGYEYVPVTTSGSGGFGAAVPFDSVVSGDRKARTIILWSTSKRPIYNFDAKGQGFGGWTLDAQHVLDPESGSLYRGDSEREGKIGRFGNPVIEAFAGGAVSGPGHWTGAANSVFVKDVTDMAVAPDGSLVIADRVNSLIRRIANGTVSSVAGGGSGTVADGYPANGAAIRPYYVAVAPDGSIIFSDSNTNRVWRIDNGPSPLLHLVAGGITQNQTGCPLPDVCGDGKDAKLADIRIPMGVAVGQDGTIYIADHGHKRIRRIGPEGIITTYGSDIDNVAELSLRADGILYAITSNHAVYRISPTGTIQQSLTGSLTQGWWGGWCGNANSFSEPRLIPLADDSLVMACDNKILGRTALGELIRLAGDGTAGYAGDGGPALPAKLSRPTRMVEGEKGEIYILDQTNATAVIRRLRAPTAVASLSSTYYRVVEKDGSLAFDFDASGRLSKTYSALRGTTLLTFNRDPSTYQLTSITDDVGQVTTIARQDKLVTITSAHGQQTKLDLDEHGWLKTVTSPKTDEITRVTHSDNGLLTKFIDPKGNVHDFGYTADGRLELDRNAYTGSKGARLFHTPGPKGWTVNYLSPEDRLTRYELQIYGPFDDNGVVDTSIVERRKQTEGHNLVTQTDRYGDGSVRRIYPDGSTTRVFSTAADPRWGAGVLHPVATQFTTGSLAMTRTEIWDNTTLATPSDPFSMTAQRITTTVSGTGVPNAVTTRVFAAGSPSMWTTTNGTTTASRQTRISLDDHERIIKIENTRTDPVSLYPISFDYDTHGRLEKVTHGTREYTRTYDDNTGWLATTTDAAGLGISYTTRDANGRPESITLPGTGRTLGLDYDIGGNLTSVTPPDKPSHTFGWGPTNQLASYNAPSPPTAQTIYSYDADGLLAWKLQPGMLSNFGYDDIGRLRQFGDSFDNTLFTYDAAGRLTTAANSSVTIENAYAGSLLATQTVTGPFANPYASTFTYDNFFRVKNWNGIEFNYNADGVLTSVGDPSPTGVQMSLSRGNTGLLNTTTLGVVTDGFTYSSGYGELSGHTSTGYSATYDRDAAGRIDTIHETIGGVLTKTHYEYDLVGRLWKVYVNDALARTYTYDKNGNRDGATYDGQDRLTQGATYNSNGDLLTKTDGAGVTTFTYDGQGSLRKVERPGPAATIEYVIDGDGRRVGKKLGGALGQGFVYSDDRVVAEVDALGQEVSRFIYATEAHSPDFMIKAGVTYRFIKDHLGSPRRVVRADTGALAQQINYDEWGVATVVTEIAAGFQPFGFAGGLWDRDTNLVRFGARDYDATIGRWTTKDASRFAGGLNFYAYAGNDPVNYFDPTGYARAPVGPGLLGRLAQWLRDKSEQYIAREKAAEFGSGCGNAGGGPWSTDAFGNGAAGAGLAILAALVDLSPSIVEMGMLGMARGPRVGPVGDAGGAHSTFRLGGDGNVKNYATWEPNPRNPGGWDMAKRFDASGPADYNKATGQAVPTPHVHDPNVPGGVRSPWPDEIP